jgi:tetratricopeptide (TPR) repeat protein
MKRNLILVILVLCPAIGLCGGRELEGILRQMVISGVSEKNPQAGQILGVVLAPRTSINAGDSYQNPTRDTRIEMYPQPRCASEMVSYGKMLGNSGSIKEALALFLQAIAIEPDNIDAHYCAGVAYAKLGDMDRARDAYDRVLKIRNDIDKKIFKLSEMLKNKEGDIYGQ